MVLSLPIYSRFKKTAVEKFADETVPGWWKRYSFLTEKLTDDQIGSFQVTTTTEGRPAAISQMIYNTPQLFWVLIAFNNATSVLNWPIAGTIIRYPVESIVIPELFR